MQAAGAVPALVGVVRDAGDHEMVRHEAAEALGLTATILEDLGIIDGVVEEPLGGARQREASDQQRDHHHVGEQGREVHQL